MFSQVYLKTTESKRDEKYTAGNRKCCGNPLGKFLNFKIAYFVLFLSQNENNREIVSFVFPRHSMFPSTSSRETLSFSGKQN